MMLKFWLLACTCTHCASKVPFTISSFCYRKKLCLALRSPYLNRVWPFPIIVKFGPSEGVGLFKFTFFHRKTAILIWYWRNKAVFLGAFPEMPLHFNCRLIRDLVDRGFA